MTRIKTLPEPSGINQMSLRRLQSPNQLVGLTCLGEELFVLRQRDADQVQVYSIEVAEDIAPLRQFSVSGLDTNDSNDMTSCVRSRCLFISDYSNGCIHKSASNGDSMAKWPVPGSPGGLSLTPANNLLVMCHHSCVNRKLLELSSDSGECVRQVELQSDIVTPLHAVQLTNRLYVVLRAVEGLFVNLGVQIVSHLCVVDAHGQISQSYKRSSGSEDTQLSRPCHMTTDANDFIFVADRDYCGVVLLSPRLEFVRHVKLEREPWRLYLDGATRHLYVGYVDGVVDIIQV